MKVDGIEFFQQFGIADDTTLTDVFPARFKLRLH